MEGGRSSRTPQNVYQTFFFFLGASFSTKLHDATFQTRLSQTQMNILYFYGTESST